MLAGLDTYTNICENWTLMDLAQSHDLLSIKEDIEMFSFEQSKKK